jgi:hypothetical protein
MLDISDIFSEDVSSSDPSKIFNDASISLFDKLKPQPVCISIGEHSFGQTIYPTPFGSYGDYSCLVGASKAKKSFMKSAICAAFFGGGSVDYFPDIKSHHTQGKWLIDIDTEQSDFHSQRVFRRVTEMVGAIPPNYANFALRRYTPQERMDFIDWLVYESPYKGKIGMISIDGYADLISDFNDIDQSQVLTSNLLKWSHDANCHVTGILHKNFGSEKPVGHVGSFVLKKAETVAFITPTLDSNGNIDHTLPVRVECRYSRNMPFDEFSFVIGSDHLPKISQF